MKSAFTWRHTAVVRLWRWLPALLWMGGIFYLSAQPQLPSLTSHWLDDMVKTAGHFGGYAVLAYLYLRIARAGRWNGRTGLGMVFGCAMLYALSDEFHQSFVPGRDPNALDLLTDAAGAATALGVAWWTARRRGAHPGG